MRYGLPYKGSKNAIARQIVSQLPEAEIFVDLFFGGGAVTHAAMLMDKYERFIINDIDGRLPKLFVECAHGMHTIKNHPEWISREEFNSKKSDDAYIALVWSFGNNGIDYIYGSEIEEYKHDFHRAVFENKPEMLRKYGIHLNLSPCEEALKRYHDYSVQIKRFLAESKTRKYDLENFERLQALERLESLYRLQSLQSHYEDVPIPTNALIYCDPPYNSTNCGKYKGFDSNRFYEWAEKQDNIFISEYEMPEPFIPIWQTEKTVLSAANTNLKTVEKLYTNQRTWKSLSEEQKRKYKLYFVEQLSFF